MPPKRSRSYLIDDLLRDSPPRQVRNQLDLPPSPKRKRPSDYIDRLGFSTRYNKTYGISQTDSKFMIKDLPEDPEGLLRGIFQFCFDEAVQECRKNGKNAERIGCIISSALLNHDIYVPFRPPNENTVDTILNMFLKVAQSKKHEDVTLWGEPFSVRISSIDVSSLPKAKRITGGVPAKLNHSASPKRKRIRTPIKPIHSTIPKKERIGTQIKPTTAKPKKKITGGAARKVAHVHHQICEKSLIKINNEGNNHCLFQAMYATLIHQIGGLDRRQFYDYLHGRRPQHGNLEEDAIQLMEANDIPLDLNEYNAEDYAGKIIDYWNLRYQGYHEFKCFIFGEMGNYKPKWTYGAEEWDTEIVLFHSQRQEPDINNPGQMKTVGHFDGVRKDKSIVKGKKYCLWCEGPFTREKEHRITCKKRCKLCSRRGHGFPCEREEGWRRKKCQDCKKKFDNSECYDHHINSKFCDYSKQCENCGVIWRKNNKQATHICGTTFCHLCHDYHKNDDRGCYIKPIEIPEKKDCVYVAFDIETMFEDPTDENDKVAHEPNFVAAKVACQKCIESGAWKSSLQAEEDIEALLNHEEEGCTVCGSNRTVTFGHRPFEETKVDSHTVTEDPMKEFVTWILTKLPDDHDKYVFSHFGGRFDMIYVFRELFRRKLSPSMLKKGNKMYEMRVKTENGNVIFRDSFNLLNMSLSQLVPSFGLDVQEKPFFPYKANKRCNYGVTMPQLPPMDDYLCKGFMPNKLKAFIDWWEANKNQQFNLDESLASYCVNDVDILMAALIVFRQEFMAKTKRLANEDGNVDRKAYKKPHNGLDPLRESMTIASSSIKHFKMNHLPFNHLAIVPERSYQTKETQSKLALKFLQWYADSNEQAVRTRDSAGGEKQIDQYKLDGWVEEEGLGIEVHGCAFHGCPVCFPEDDMILPNGKAAGWQREKDEERFNHIRSHPEVNQVDVYWECRIKQMLDTDRVMRQRFDEYLDEGPLDIRSCFFGGRTHAHKLLHTCAPGEKISYYDVTSLYPYINFQCDDEFKDIGYPIGHPNLHVINQNVQWTRPEDNPYKIALMKAFVLPPRQIDVTVLPMRLENDERLLFPLCAACARLYIEGHVDINGTYVCPHTDRQRGFVAYCTSLELNAALAEGYTVTRLMRVLEYEETDAELFRPYMREFLTEKFHASGWDPSMKDDEEAQQKFIEECKEKFGITIDPTKMELNPGRRALAKLLLNNLWGRFSLRNFGLWQTEIISDPAVLREYLDRRDIDVMAIDEITMDGEIIMLSYTTKKDFVIEGDSSNVVISLWTTSCARLKLLRLMQKVARTPGCRILYTDTDSIIFAHPADACPLELSPHLGGLTDEFKNHTILEFVSGGSKQYALKLHKHGAPADQYEYCIKIRGITLNADVMDNQGLRYETFKEKVVQFVQTGEVQPIKVQYPYFLRPSVRDGVVFSKSMSKGYRPFVAKGVVRPNYDVLDFGYTPI